jgi:hypothetical protein
MSEDSRVTALSREGLLKMARERLSARREAEVAVRHERLAASGPERMRAFHLRMARVHRQAEYRHDTAAEIHSVLAAKAAAYISRAAALDVTRLLMTTVATAADAEGAAVTFYGGEHEELLCATSDGRVKELQDTEFVCGEGPTLTSVLEGRMVSLRRDEFEENWPVYGPAAVELGVERIVAVPAVFAPRAHGALTVLNPGRHGSAPVAAGLSLLSDALFRFVLPAVHGGPEETDALPLLERADRRASVHQATGIIAEQCGCTLADARALLRARAFAVDRPAGELAQAVIEHEVRFDG